MIPCGPLYHHSDCTEYCSTTELIGRSLNGCSYSSRKIFRDPITVKSLDIGIIHILRQQDFADFAERSLTITDNILLLITNLWICCNEHQIKDWCDWKVKVDHSKMSFASKPLNSSNSFNSFNSFNSLNR